MRKRIFALLSALLLALAGSVLFAPSAAADGKGGHGHGHFGFGCFGKKASLPDVIALPDGLQPEGISAWGRWFFVGSRATGEIYRGNVVTGEGQQLVAPTGTPAIGTEVDWRGRLWVAGGPSGLGKVYNARTGEPIGNPIPLTAAGTETVPTFINDVVVTRDAAYFTDSQKAKLFRVAIARNGAIAETATEIDLAGKGDYQHVAGFNLNGIEAARGGRVLFVVQSSTGLLFTVDPATGVSKKVDVAALPSGDGLLRYGQSLYVVTRPATPEGVALPAEIVQLRLSRDLASATVVERITDTDFDVPATVAGACGSLYAVNARFTTTDPQPIPCQVVRVHR